MKRIVWLALCLGVASAMARISAYDPAESPSYDIVDKLEAYGCARATLRALRPMGHASLRDALLLPKGHGPCRAPDWLQLEGRLLLRPALQNDVYARLLLTHNEAVPLLGTEATVTPLYALRAGRTTFNGPNLYLEVNGNAEAGRDFGVAFSATPGFVGALDDYRSVNGRFYLQEGYLKVGYKEVALTWGRQALQFGTARHGNLLLSGAMKPLNLWRFSVQPHAPLEDLGPIGFDAFLADEGDSRFVSGAKLLGVELGWRPTDWLELAFLELYQYGGTGAPKLEASDYLKMLYYSGDETLSTKRNRNFATHLSVWFPDHVVQLYSQFLFTTLGASSDWFSQDLSVLVGAWFPDVWPEGDIRLEYVHTVANAYRHPFWRQGLTTQGTPIGSPLGPDGEGVYLDFGIPHIDEWRPSIGLFYEARAKHPPPGLATESRFGGGIGAEARWAGFLLSLDAKYARAQNYLYRPGDGENVLALWGTLKYSFL